MIISVHNSVIRESGYTYMQRLRLQVFTDGKTTDPHTHTYAISGSDFLTFTLQYHYPLHGPLPPHFPLTTPLLPPLPPPLPLHLTSGVPHCPRRSQIVAIAVLDIVFVLLQPRELGGVINEQGLLTLNCNLKDR